MSRAIVFSRVSKAFNGERIIDALNWTLPTSGSLCLFGPSGCGKTTLLHLLAGILQPDSGHISGLAERKVAVVFQEPRLLPWLSALHNISAVLPEQAHDGMGREEAAYKWLQRVGLARAADKRPDELSGGMRQRVAIARALAYGGDLLLLDEPTQGLDAAMQEQVIDLLRAYEKDRLTVLVTHDRAEAERMQSTILTITGPPVQLHV